MTFVRPSLSDLIERNRGDIETRLPGADSRLRHSVLDTIARMHGGAAAGLYGYLDFLSLQLMPDTAEAAYLARWASIWGIRRKASVAARVLAGATGANGATIPEGTEATRIDGARYRVLSAATIAAGTAGVSIEAIEPGPGGDVAAATALTFSSAVAGVDATLTVAGAVIPGTAEEDDASLLGRLLDRIRRPPQGGASNDYVAWALAQPGVTRAWAYGQWLGIGTVGVTFAMDGREDILPLGGDVAAVQAALDILRPVTAELTVFAPVPAPLDVVLRIVPDTADIRAAVEDELADFFTRDAEPGGTIYLSRLDEAISLAAGEFQHAVELPDRDFAAAPGAMPMLGPVVFVS